MRHCAALTERNNKDQVLLNIPRPFAGSRVSCQIKSRGPIQQHLTNPANPLLVKELHYDVPTKHNPTVIFLHIRKRIYILNQLHPAGIDRLIKELHLFNRLQSLGNRGCCFSFHLMSADVRLPHCILRMNNRVDENNISQPI